MRRCNVIDLKYSGPGNHRRTFTAVVDDIRLNLARSLLARPEQLKFQLGRVDRVVIGYSRNQLSHSQ